MKNISFKSCSRHAILFAFGLGFILSAACKKSPEQDRSASPAPSLDPEQISEEYQYGSDRVSEKELIAQINASKKVSRSGKDFLIAQVPEEILRLKQQAKDRQELVIPAPPNWKPEDARRKIKLTLIPERTMIRIGERFRYRLEIQNAGRERVSFGDAFIKNGRIGSGGFFGFKVARPGHEEQEVGGPFLGHGKSHIREYKFPDSMTSAEKDAAFARIQLEERAQSNFSMLLRSGETLFTRPDSPPPNRFRDLRMHFEFTKAGTYRIKAIYNDPPRRRNPSTAKEIAERERLGITEEDNEKIFQESARNSLGLVESNIIILEVTP